LGRCLASARSQSTLRLQPLEPNSSLPGFSDGLEDLATVLFARIGVTPPSERSLSPIPAGGLAGFGSLKRAEVKNEAIETCRQPRIRDRDYTKKIRRFQKRVLLI
jgi:hypothetical protein